MSSPGSHQSDMSIRVNVVEVEQAQRALEALERVIRSIVGGSGPNSPMPPAGGGGGTPPPPPPPTTPGGAPQQPFGNGMPGNVSTIAIQQVDTIHIHSATTVNITGGGGNPGAMPSVGPSPTSPGGGQPTPPGGGQSPSGGSSPSGGLPFGLPPALGAALPAYLTYEAVVRSHAALYGGVTAGLRSQSVGYQGAQAALMGQGSIYDNEWDAHLRRTQPQADYLASIPVFGQLASPIIQTYRAEQQRQAEAERFSELMENKSDIWRSAGFGDRAKRVEAMAKKARRDSDFEDDVRRFNSLADEYGGYGFFDDFTAGKVKGDASATDAYKRQLRAMATFINPNYGGGMEAFLTGRGANRDRMQSGAIGKILAGDTGFLTDPTLMGELRNQDQIRQFAVGLSESRYRGAFGSLEAASGEYALQVAMSTGGSLDTRQGALRTRASGLRTQLVEKQTEYSLAASAGADKLELEKLRNEMQRLEAALASNTAASRDMAYAVRGSLAASAFRMSATDLQEQMRYGFGNVSSSDAQRRLRDRMQVDRDIANDPTKLQEDREEARARLREAELQSRDIERTTFEANRGRVLSRYAPPMAAARGEASYASYFGTPEEGFAARSSALNLSRGQIGVSRAMLEEQRRRGLIDEATYNNQIASLVEQEYSLKVQERMNPIQRAQEYSSIASSQAGVAGAQYGVMMMGGSVGAIGARREMVGAMERLYGRQGEGLQYMTPGSVMYEQALAQQMGTRASIMQTLGSFDFAASPGSRMDMSTGQLQMHALSSLFSAQGEMRPLLQKQLDTVNKQLGEMKETYESQRKTLMGSDTYKNSSAEEQRALLGRAQAEYTERRNQLMGQGIDIESRLQVGFLDKVVSNVMGQSAFNPELMAEFSRAELGLRGSISTQLFGGNQRKIEQARRAGPRLLESFAGNLETSMGMQDTVGKAANVMLGGEVTFRMIIDDTSGRRLHDRNYNIDAAQMQASPKQNVSVQL